MAFMNTSWEETFALEIGRARQAQALGNLGQARVCARRAAGVAVGEYLKRKGLPDAGPSAIDRLRYLAGLAETPDQAQPLIERLLMRVSEEFKLPEGVDLIADATALTKCLLG
jgi:hypothetical protein